MQPIFDSDSDSLQLTKRHFSESLKFPTAAIMLLWLVHLLFLILGIDPGDYGVFPRSVYGMRGIALSPLVHGSWMHLVSNTVPLFVLTALTFYFYPRVALRSFIFIYLGTGLAVWLFARPVIHIGASGVVYGLVAFLFWNGIFRRSTRSIILSLVVLFFYSGMFAGILPDQPGISWESHLLGSLVGVMSAYVFKGVLEEEELVRQPRLGAKESQPLQAFLPFDTFEKTKRQRWEEEQARIQAELEAMQRAFYWHQNSTGSFHFPPKQEE
jgi:membrane associated rhomboid family serine protease